MEKEKASRAYLIKLANDEAKLGYLAIAEWYASIPEPSAKTEQELQAKILVCMNDVLVKAKRLHPERKNDFDSVADKVKEELLLRAKATRAHGLREKRTK